MAPVAAPVRTNDQRFAALRRANEVRVLRGQLKDGLTVDRAIEVLYDTPDWAEQMKVLELLLALPKYGASKTGRTLRSCQVSPSKRISGLTDRQRVALTKALRP